MLELSGAFPIRVTARFSFFAVLGLLVCMDKDGTALMCGASCMLHELGHIAVMLIERKPPNSVTLYGGGIHITGGSTSIPAAAAGVTVNIMLFVVFGIIPWENPQIRLWGAVNLLTALFNLLPMGALDGKLLFDKALLRVLSPVSAARVSYITEKTAAIIIIPCAVTLVLAGYMNFSAVIFLIYVFAVEFLEKI